MVLRRITSSKVDWAKMTANVPPAQKTQFLAFKGKSDALMRK